MVYANFFCEAGEGPNEAWMMQIGRNLTDPIDGFLVEKELLILDRDSKFFSAFQDLLDVDLPLGVDVYTRASGHLSRRFPLSLHDWGGLLGTPGDSRGQRVRSQPVAPLRFDHESRASPRFLENKGRGFESRRLHH